MAQKIVCWLCCRGGRGRGCGRDDRARPGKGWALFILVSENKLTTFTKGTGIGPIYKFEMEDDGQELPLDYDVAAMEQFFKKRPLEVLCRTGEILSEVLPYFTRAFIWEYLIR